MASTKFPRLSSRTPQRHRSAPQQARSCQHKQLQWMHKSADLSFLTISKISKNNTIVPKGAAHEYSAQLLFSFSILVYSAPDTVIMIFSGAIDVFLCTISMICAVCASVRLGASIITSATSPLMLTTVWV